MVLTLFSIREFDRNVRNTVQRIGLSPQEAYKAGYVDQILGGQIRGVLLEQAASKHGIRISDERVADKIKAIVLPMTSQGQSAKTVLQQILVSQGLSEQGFIASIKREMASDLLSQPLEETGAFVPASLVQAAHKYENEKRDIRFIRFLFEDLKDIPKPSAEQLEVFYDKVKESYAEEERRDLKIIKIDTKALEAAT